MKADWAILWDRHWHLLSMDLNTLCLYLWKKNTIQALKRHRLSIIREPLYILLLLRIMGFSVIMGNFSVVCSYCNYNLKRTENFPLAWFCDNYFCDWCSVSLGRSLPPPPTMASGFGVFCFLLKNCYIGTSSGVQITFLNPSILFSLKSHVSFMRLVSSVAEASDWEILHHFSDSKMVCKWNRPLSSKATPQNWPQQVGDMKEPVSCKTICLWEGYFPIPVKENMYVSRRERRPARSNILMEINVLNIHFS